MRSPGANNAAQRSKQGVDVARSHGFDHLDRDELVLLPVREGDPGASLANGIVRREVKGQARRPGTGHRATRSLRGHQPVASPA
jgi:hypothetical protein